MTFDNTAWAIDGATMRSSLARTEAYIACSGAQGVAQRGDLKVSQLAGGPGNGLTISAGSGIILNGYQGNVNTVADQSYTVSNPTAHVVTSGDMPASSGSALSYILAIVIGDPEFAQTGHPFMGPTDPPSGEESTFLYVRPVMIPCSSGATSLSPTIGYPALPLARIDIPASTTSITNAMIHDIRDLARPRSSLQQGFVAVSPGQTYSDTSWHRIGSSCLTVTIPPWAVKAKIIGYVEGLRLLDQGVGSVSAYVESDSRSSEITNVNENAPGSVGDRRSYNVGGVISVSDLAGTTQSFSLRFQCNSGSASFMKSDTASSGFLSVYFEEQPI